jgi:hypothetical protein
MDELTNKFVKLNSFFWPKIKRSKDKILIEGFLTVPSYLMTAATIARAINDVKKYEPIVISSRNLGNKNETKKIFESYGIRSYLDFNKYKFHIFFLLKAVVATLKVYINNPSLDCFISYKLNGIKIGDLIYDTYIRHGNRYSKVKLWSLSFLKELLRSHFKFYIYN